MTPMTQGILYALMLLFMDFSILFKSIGYSLLATLLDLLPIDSVLGTKYNEGKSSLRIVFPALILNTGFFVLYSV